MTRSGAAVAGTAGLMGTVSEGAPAGEMTNAPRADTADPASIAFQQSGRGSVPRSLWSEVRETHYSVKSHGATGGNTATDSAKLQLALDNAPLGSTVFFPPGRYLTTGLTMSRQVSLRFDPGATLIGIGNDPTAHVLNVKLREAIDNSGGTTRFDNLRVYCAVGANALSCLNLESQADEDVSLIGVIVNGGLIFATDQMAGAAVRIAGLTSQKHLFSGTEIVNQVSNAGSDGTKFVGCNVHGIKPAFVLKLNDGAFKTGIYDCLISARDGALVVRRGSAVDFLRNSIEQGAAYGENRNPAGASILLEALDRDLHSITIEGNNFVGSENKLAAHILARTADRHVIEGLKIRNNIFGQTRTKVDIVFADAGVRYAQIAFDQELRGDRGGGGWTVYPAYSPNRLDVGDLLVVADNGIGTSNVRKSATALGGPNPETLLNGWACHPAMRFFKDASNHTVFSGEAFAPGLRQGGVTVGVLPIGFRPVADEQFALAATDPATMERRIAFCDVLAASGEIRIGAVIDGQSTGRLRVGLAGIRFLAKREGYNPGY